MAPDAEPIHVVIPTHTPRYLDLVLVALARQSRRPDTVTVSCDTDDPTIGETIAHWSDRLSLGVSWVRRAPHDTERLCQVRNNAVRHLVETPGVEAGRLLVLDGDMIPADDALERHAILGASADLLLPYRINVDERTTASLNPERLLNADPHPLSPRAEEIANLRRRDRRYRKHLLLRRLRLGPLHKPKLLGGHFSCPLPLYLRLNGFDERYQGWGFKDDEFAFRAARLGASARPACAEIIAFHLHHPTRQPDAPMRTLPTARRFARRRSLPTVAEHGVRNPLPQNAVEATRFGPGVASEGTMRP